jgi:DNA-binding NtrC family response regulator
MSAPSPVLITWVAINNDPYERVFKSPDYRLVDGAPVPGPTLTLLCDEESKYAGVVRDVVLLHRQPTGPSAEREQRAVQETADLLREKSIRVHLEAWVGEDPTDHRGIFEFLRDTLPQLRRRYRGRELVLHISPGTPSMHTIWVLMAETGFVEPPFTLVKSYRRSERRGRPAVVPVEVGIETFYKIYKASRPRQIGSEEQGVIWDPLRFKTDRMKAVYAEARRFAQINVPVLIRGERGTGKTTLASWIRSNGPFKREEQNARWPSVACGQYSPETMRAELFGYTKGAFTGATGDKPGLLAAAHGDTLFLDEVGDVSRDLQRLLIKAVEEKRYYALGDDRPRESDFRLLTATNIEEAELRRRLDPDFLDRISLLTLEIPALRDVADELPWLWEAVYYEATGRAGVTKRRAEIGSAHHQRIVSHLRRHPLPGNLRDLFRVAYRVLAARNDVESPLAPADAADYGIASLTGGVLTNTTTAAASRQIAAAFAHAAPMDDLVKTASPLNTSSIVGDFKAFMASELRRIAADRGMNPAELCDVSERSLRGWARVETVARQEAATDRNETSDTDEV